MSKFKTLAVAGLCLAAATLAGPAVAQSTDGYHAIQIFPLAVDTASFTQHFVFRNPDATNALVIYARYFPGTGTTQATSLVCPVINVPANGQVSFDGLRALCPGLATGSQFGYLYTDDNNQTRRRPYAAYSRVSNPQGIGFSVEAFPSHTFTSADGVVTGARRFATTAQSPGFQTNCFVGKLHNELPTAPVNSQVLVSVYDSTGAKLGTTTSFTVAPGALTRLLDVFAAVGAPAGNYNDARVTFEESGTGEPGILSYCTVQDNTSFGADFRISKQERGYSPLAVGQFPLAQVPAAQDEHEMRDSLITSDIPMPGFPTGRPFTILAGTTGVNTHVIYFRHPDYVQCELIDPATGLRAAATSGTTGYGLEMRLVGTDGLVVAGGNNATGFDSTYLGDKATRNSGSNTRYTIEVESSGVNTTAARPYKLHCISGSGHSAGEIVNYQEATTRF